LEGKEKAYELRVSEGYRREMSAHSSQIEEGIIPIFIKIPKILHPRQYPRAASNTAAMLSIPITIWAAPTPTLSARTRAVEENATPIPWAKRFGGPGIIFAWPEN
jgi:hypothetical protein